PPHPAVASTTTTVTSARAPTATPTTSGIAVTSLAPAPGRGNLARPAARVVRPAGEARAVLTRLLQQALALLGRDSPPDVPHRERDAPRADPSSQDSGQPRHRRILPSGSG